MKIYIDGALLDESNAKISVLDHGLLYGDGVFEGIRLYNKRIFKLEEHTKRLFDSAQSIMLQIPISQEEMNRAIINTVKANELVDGYIRVVITRGVGDLGLDPRKCPKPSIIIIANKIKLYPQSLYENGLSIITVPTRRNIPEAINPQIKSLNYLNNILAKIEAVHRGYEEALMLNHAGYVAECTGDNIFMVNNGVLITPPTAAGVLEGITAKVVMEIASNMGIKISRDWITRHDLFCSQEVFLTGTAAEIIPVVKIDDRTIGNGEPGSITKTIIEEFRYLVLNSGISIS